MELMETFESANGDAIRWECRADLRPVFFDADALPIEKWQNDNCLQIVKHAMHRTVYHVHLPGVRFYLKHYPKADMRAWFRQLVRPSKARIEFDKAIEIARRGVATVEPLALGECPSWLGSGESYLITRELDGTQPLNEFLDREFPRLPTERQSTIRRRLATGLGTFLAQLHDAGIQHNDLHAGNLLLRLSPDDKPSLFLIDLHAVGLGESMDWETSRGNLVLLNRWFSVFAERSDRGRFWKAYCQARTHHSERKTWRERAVETEQATWESNLHFWRRRDLRCTTTNRYFRRVQSSKCGGFAVTDLDEELLSRLSNAPDDPFADPNQRLLKDSRSSTVVEMEAVVAGEKRPVIYKRINPKKWGDSWKAITRQSGLWRSWIFGHGLLHRALPTARPLAVFHRKQAGLPSHGYVLMEKINGAVNLRDFAESLQNDLPQSRELKNNILTQLAKLIRRMHKSRLSHRDLKATNILVQRDDQDAAPTIWFIDLEGIRLRPNDLCRKRRIKDLTRLNASFLDHPAITNADRLRFLRLYLECAWVGRSNWKLWWNEIEKATERKISRNKRRNRPLM